MGFASGFTGGVTLTLGITYLTVFAHQRNRRMQAENLRSQSRVLHSLLEPSQLPPSRTRAELAREERGTLVETAKDRWNDEVENAVRWVQRTDWDKLRGGVEGVIAGLLGARSQESTEIIGDAKRQSVPTVHDLIDGSKVSAAAKSKANETASLAKEPTSVTEAKASKIRGVSELKTGQVTANINNSGSIDEMRGTVRDTVSQGIKMGKDAVSKAQAAVGLATERIESKAQSSAISHASAVEKAFHERYDKPNTFDRSVEDVLYERYKPIDERDNTVLRGI